MNFNLDIWKDQAHQKIQTLGERLKTTTVKGTPLMVYSFLSTFSIWPLVEAAKAGQLMPMIVALSGITAGVGGNLLANQIQAWKDRTDEVDEETVALWITEQVQGNPELQEALDSVLDKLGTLSVAQESLDDSLRDTLRQELAQLGNLTRFEASITKGTGAIAQGDNARSAVATDEAVAVAGDVKGNLVINRQPAPPSSVPPDPAKSRQADLENRYMKRLARQCNVLPLAALGGEEGSEEEVSLAEIYVALDTTTRIPLEDEGQARQPGRPDDRALTALEAAAQTKRLVLLGDPGSGKSTFVRQLTAWLASAYSGEEHLPPGYDTIVWPLIMTGRALAQRLAQLNLQSISDAERDRRLVQTVQSQWQADSAHPELTTSLDDVLADKAIVFIVDGLDEVPETLRSRVRQAVQAVLKTYPDVFQVIITCRIRSYTGATVFKGFTPHRLADFDEAKIKRFVHAWYRAQVDLGHLTQTEGEERRADLEIAALSEGLRKLSSNPMILTTMSIIHQQEVGLPEERVKLYDLAVQIFLNRWRKHKGIAVSDRVEAILKDDLKLRTLMEHLAYEAHQRQSQDESEADLTRMEILALLEKGAHLGDIGLAGEFLDYVDQQAGLLVGQGGYEEAERDTESGDEPPQTYTFPHRTFQEYLAGCRMVSGRGIERKYWKRAKEGDYWYVAIQMGAEELLYNKRTPETLLDLAYNLCQNETPTQPEGWRASLWSGQLAVIAGRRRIEADADKPEGGLVYLDRLLPRLVQILQADDRERSNKLSPLERAIAGRILGQLGDPRPSVVPTAGETASITLPNLEFCYVPAGEFVMGSEESVGGLSEAPVESVKIAYPYWIGRFPITVGQYQVFIDDGGYKDGAYWDVAKANGLWENGKVKRRVYVDGGWVDERADSSFDFGFPYHLPNHPAVGVSWYEMLAYCNWLTTVWHRQGILPPNWHVKLPSEAEWEKAARGGTKILASPLIKNADQINQFLSPKMSLSKNPLPQRHYPWGDDIETRRLNFFDTSIESPSAVGCFMAGASPYGCQDMSGNVWEWTRSSDEKYPYVADDGREDLDNTRSRVLRGGAFDFNLQDVRCAVRDRSEPVNWDYDLGFRVLASPSSEL